MNMKHETHIFHRLPATRPFRLMPKKNLFTQKGGHL